jgi:hypothetical protein
MTKTEWMNWVEEAWNKAQQSAWAEKGQEFECVKAIDVEAAAEQSDNYAAFLAGVRFARVNLPAPSKEWVGLTDEERERVRSNAGYNQFMSAGEYAELVQRATEAKLKEKNA